MDFSKKTTLSRRFSNLIFLPLLMLSQTAALSGEGSTLDQWGQLTIDNDAIVGEDDGYTGGLAYNWGYTGFSDFDSKALPAWIHHLTKNLYISTLPDRQRAAWAMLFAYQVGTDQFEEQDYDTKFGTLSMAYRF